jgi:hypothetical protein
VSKLGDQKQIFTCSLSLTSPLASASFDIAEHLKLNRVNSPVDIATCNLDVQPSTRTRNSSLMATFQTSCLFFPSAVTHFRARYRALSEVTNLLCRIFLLFVCWLSSFALFHVSSVLKSNCLACKHGSLGAMFYFFTTNARLCLTQLVVHDSMKLLKVVSWEYLVIQY